MEAIAIHRFIAIQKGDLTFAKGDKIVVLEKLEEEGWWFGKTEDGKQGIFPYNRVKITESQPKESRKILGATVHALESGSFEINVILGSNKRIKQEKDLWAVKTLSTVVRCKISLLTPDWALHLPVKKKFLPEREENVNNIIQDVLKQKENEDTFLYWLDPAEASKHGIGETELNQFMSMFKRFSTASPMPGNDGIQLAQVTFEWFARDKEEMSALVGEFVEIISVDIAFKGWSTVKNVVGKEGLIPSNYYNLIEDHKVKDDFFKGGNNLLRRLPTLNPPEEKLPNQSTMKSQTDQNYEVQEDQRAMSSIKNVSVGKPKPRKRQKYLRFALNSVEKFEELFETHFAIDFWEKAVQAQSASTPKNMDTVTLNFNAFIFEPQKQSILEFLSSDVLLDNLELKAGEKAENTITSGKPLVFQVGTDAVIDGLDRAVKMMHVGDSLRVVLGPRLAYSDIGARPIIPPNAILLYDLYLVDIQPRNELKVALRPNVLPMGIMKSVIMERLPNHNGQKPKKRGKQKATVREFKGYFSYPELLKIIEKQEFDQYGILPGIIEEYLRKDEFKKVFGMTFEKFSKLSPKQKDQRRKKANLW
eukprot:maker-scaffold_61-snap-gene-0.12-mRNA-1 protein AED:0.00 eAED:0.00 QI:107/1/1/1/1/1/3/36/589